LSSVSRLLWQSFLLPSSVGGAWLISVSLLYGFELYYAIQLLQSPAQADSIFILATLLLGIDGVGLVRAWELLGARRYGIFGWLNPLRVDDKTSVAEQEDRKAANSATPQKPVKEQAR